MSQHKTHPKGVQKGVQKRVAHIYSCLWLCAFLGGCGWAAGNWFGSVLGEGGKIAGGVIGAVAAIGLYARNDTIRRKERRELIRQYREVGLISDEEEDEFIKGR